MRQATRAPVNGQLFNCNLPYCIGWCWKTESLRGSTTDLWECWRPSPACVFLPERYYLTVAKGNAFKTLIQKPVSLANSMLHAVDTVRDICVLRAFFTLHFMVLLQDFKAEKDHGYLAL